MHMADALLSPAVGGTMWAVTAGITAYSARKLKESGDDARIPLMGVLGAFIFAAQMINFSIPATGSSGHIGGGMILAILLGPYAAFVVLASVLAVQALFFADGGLLALGCNIFNLAFFPCFVAYPFVYRAIVDRDPSNFRIMIGSVASVVVALQLGAFSVVLETLASGISELPFRTFLLLMQPIHLAIGLVEGVITAAVVSFVWKARPEVIQAAQSGTPFGAVSLKKVMVFFLAATVITGGVLSWFASSFPDGLEWAIERTSGQEELEPPEGGIHSVLAVLQERFSFLPDYGFRENAAVGEEDAKAPAQEGAVMDTGTSVSGLVGGMLVFLVAAGTGLLLRKTTTVRR